MNHSFLGIPSVTISAAVAKDKVIMWHVVEGNWNGAAAAAMGRLAGKPPGCFYDGDQSTGGSVFFNTGAALPRGGGGGSGGGP